MVPDIDMKSKWFLLFAMLFLWMGCATVTEKPPVQIPPVQVPSTPLVLIGQDEWPPLFDDLDGESLALAIDRSLQYYERLPDDMVQRYGERTCTIAELRQSLEEFLLIYQMAESEAMRERCIREAFDMYRAAGRDGRGEVLFTGYYAPLLEGSLKETVEFRYPIYRTPDDHVVVNLGRFKAKYEGERVIARIENGEAVPYYTREHIDIDECLRGKNLEIVWLADPVDVFFLHIQGSGIVRFPDGSSMNVSYAQSNGHPYRSVGRLLINQRELTAGQVSMKGIKRYLRDHPDEMLDILAHNESYVFFRIVQEGPIGCLNVPVTGGRSIATDSSLFPKGGLAFIRVQKPIVDDNGRIVSWTPFSRFVLNQDTGGAIKGPGRVDLFCGEGRYAEVHAGHLKENGDLYFLIKKKNNQ